MRNGSIQKKLAASTDELAKAELANAMSAQDADEASLALHNAIALCEVFHAVELLEDDVVVSLAVMQWSYLHEAKELIDGSPRA